jgi:hypothetical protein
MGTLVLAKSIPHRQGDLLTRRVSLQRPRAWQRQRCLAVSCLGHGPNVLRCTAKAKTERVMIASCSPGDEE